MVRVLCALIVLFGFGAGLLRAAEEVPAWHEERTLVSLFPRDCSVSCLAISHDGRYLAVGSGEKQPGGFATGVLTIWCLPDGEELHRIAFSRKGYGCTSITFSADSKVLAAHMGEPVTCFWNPESGELLKEVDCGVRAQGYGNILSLLSPNPLTEDTPSAWLVAGQTEAPRAVIRLFNGRGEAVATIPGLTDFAADPLNSPRAEFYDTAVSPDGLLATADLQHGTISLWSITEQRRIKAFKGGPASARPSSVAFSPDGETVASAGWDDSKVRLWRVQGPGRKQELKVPGSDYGRRIAYHPNGQLLAVQGETATALCDIGQKKVVATLPLLYNFAFAPDGRLYGVTGEGQVVVWSCLPGETVAAASSPPAE